MPLRHSKDDFKRQKYIFVLKLDIIVEYGLSYFAASFVARILWNVAHSFPIAPFVPKTRGGNTPCSISITPLLDTLFFSFSRRSRINSVDLHLPDAAFRCATLTS